MFKNLMILFMLFSVISLITTRYASNIPTAIDTTASTTNETIQNFSFTDIQGKTGTLGQYKGKAVILHFWATWCAPCVEEMPELIQKANATPNVIFLLISVDHSIVAVQNFFGRMPIRTQGNIVLAYDPQSQIADLFKVSGLPATFILSSEGKLVQQFTGPAAWQNLQIR